MYICVRKLKTCADVVIILKAQRGGTALPNRLSFNFYIFFDMDSFTLSRNWFNFSFENPDKVNPNHAALYFFIIEHCNRLGGKEKFGLPMEMAKEAIGIKNYRTYAKTFQDLIDWGFIKLIQKSKNQYSSNVIAIVFNTKAQDKALDKALQKHSQSHSQKQGQSIVGIDKQQTTNNKQETNKQILIPEFSEFLNYALEKEPLLDEKFVKLKYESWIENGWKNGNGKELKNWKSNLLNTIPFIQKNQNGSSQQNNSADRLKRQFAERVQKTMGC